MNPAGGRPVPRSVLVLLCLAAPCLPVDSPWLLRHQEDDGRFEAQDSTRDLRVTALSLLLLLQDGNDRTSGPHHREVRRASDWLLDQREGPLALAGEPEPGQVRDHALATLALVELLALDGDPELRARIPGWVTALELAIHPDGGWSADPGEAPDSLTTGWALVALRDARREGVAVSQRALSAGDRFLRACFDAERGLVALEPGREADRLAPTALAFLSRSLSGRRLPGEPWLQRARAGLRAAGPGACESGEGIDWESLYAASVAVYLLGGRDWSEWSDGLKPLVTRELLPRERYHAARSPHEPGGALGAHAWGGLVLAHHFRYTRILLR